LRSTTEKPRDVGKGRQVILPIPDGAFKKRVILLCEEHMKITSIEIFDCQVRRLFRR
jgi:hypothetical protein